jgi:hypothetical protein
MNQKLIYILAVFLFLATGMSSCKKQSYLTDGGVSNPHTSLSTYDYLKGNAYHYFDTTILLIDHFNLKDSVNKAGTFFAFTDYSINLLMLQLGVTSLDQLYDSISSKFLTQYMFTDTSITLANASTTAVQYTNWVGDSLAPCAVRKLEQTYTVSLTNTTPAFDYYTLQYIKINGVLDGSPGAPANDPVDNYLSCQTTGILTSSGTTLHVLVNNATLNKL